MTDIRQLLNNNPLKFHFEREIYNLFLTTPYLINNKRVLDIGTRNGLNLLILKKIGATEVFGIDIDDSRFNEYNLMDISLKRMDIYEYEVKDKFDVITIFLWNFHIPQYDKLAIKLKELIKKDGSIIIGFYDELYKYGYNGQSNTGSVIELFQKYYRSVTIIYQGLQWFIEIK